MATTKTTPPLWFTEQQAPGWEIPYGYFNFKK